LPNATPLTIMDSNSFMALVAICAPLVAPSTASAVVATESSFNTYAIGVVGGRLLRQPRNAEEALATAVELRVQGRNFSVGLAQINIRNVERFGLSLSDGFDACKNLGAMQTVLTGCFRRASTAGDSQAALRRALSCYYSGDFTTGFRHGYVDRVVNYTRKTTRAPP
jgi:type IV secretion system protein VirB1